MKLRSLVIAGALLAAPLAPAAYAQVLTPDVRYDGYARSYNGYSGNQSWYAAPSRQGHVYWNSENNKNMSGPGNEGAIHDNGTGGGDGAR